MSRPIRLLCCVWVVLLWTAAAWAQRCTEGRDLDPATRGALESTAQQFFQMAARGDSTSLQQDSIPAVAQDFNGIAGAVRDNLASLQGSQPSVRAVYLLDASGETGTIERAEFDCGIFGPNGMTANSTVFIIPNLPPGKYAVAIVDAQGAKNPFSVSFVLQQIGTAWKLAGYYAKSGLAAGHDGNWYVQQARDFKAKNQKLNAYFYYWQARDLLAPVPFMGTLQTNRLYDEMQQATPPDVPLGQTVPFPAQGKTYQLMSMFPLAVGNDFDLVVKYQTNDVSDTAKAWQSNMDLINALLNKYPELREGFQGVVARGVTQNGQDYGTLAPTKQAPNSPQSAKQ